MTGLLSLPWWGYILVTLGLTHVTIAAVTIYLHRNQAHRAIDLHPAVGHFFRSWLWLTTGIRTVEWVAIHRKHHAHVETTEDPHSPQILGINTVLWQGAEVYRAEYVNHPETMSRFGHGTPKDWLERHVYGVDPLSYLGISLMLILNCALFGPLGLTIWAVQMAWIPLFAAGIVNGLGHYWGYRNFATADTSTNLIPWGVLIGGEELHNNHHAFGSSAKFAVRPWEFDIGWVYIQVLQSLGLARVKKVAPQPAHDPAKIEVDLDTVQAVLTNRYHVLAEYMGQVLNRVYHDEFQRAEGESRALIEPVKALLHKPDFLMDEAARASLALGLAQSAALARAVEFRDRLQALWLEKSATYDRLVAELEAWCKEAERSGIASLAEFARFVPTYTHGHLPMLMAKG
jgi:stearoyl-CoA desaturase (delta-9 desaturase)